jgi:hypothetical protein
MRRHRWRCPYTLSVGAFVLGALETRERDDMLRHLPGCDLCREEVVDLAPLPGLLNLIRTR